MYYAILDSTGNLVESYEEECEAREALEKMAHGEPDAAEHLALLVYDDRGQPIGEAIAVREHPTTR